jgi:hypothetical protein
LNLATIKSFKLFSRNYLARCETPSYFNGLFLCSKKGLRNVNNLMIDYGSCANVDFINFLKSILSETWFDEKTVHSSMKLYSEIT